MTGTAATNRDDTTYTLADAARTRNALRAVLCWVLLRRPSDVAGHAVVQRTKHKQPTEAAHAMHQKAFMCTGCTMAWRTR